MSLEEKRQGRGLENGVRERGDPREKERAKDRARRGTEVRERRLKLLSRLDQFAHSGPLRSEREPRRRKESSGKRDVR